uniref:Rho guanine nucleotide exchange factor 7 n=1 Tax=Parascaris univalens TaxID=6257 RepID=A0A914ZBL5_PARUN
MSNIEGLHEESPSSSDVHSAQSKQNTHNGGVPVFARAKHSFEGRNNDELSFRKGDIITITQQLEGGWWEGTLHSNTGWFPCDYVVIIPPSERFLRTRTGTTLANGQSTISAEEMASFAPDTSRQTYRQQIMKGFLESELKYVQSITNFYNDVMLKIKVSKMISEEDFEVLAGNLQLLVVHQREVFDKMHETVERDVNNAKIGGILLRAAPLLRQLLRFYCENHPKAVDLILQNRNEYERIASELGWSIKDFISSLSRPFRHLDTYASTLNELERSMNEAHPDRGDTQRAASVFRDISNYCATLRKQKEMQLELKSSGLVEGLSSAEMNQLGEIIYMGTVSVGDEDELNDEQLPNDRCIVLFVSTVVVLEITPNMNSYVLKQTIPTEGIIVQKAEGKATLYLCSVNGTKHLSMNISSNDELQRWLESFAMCPKLVIDDSCCSSISPVQPQRIEMGSVRSVAEISPLRKAEVSQLPSAIKADNAKKIEVSSGFRFDHELEMILPECGDESEEPKRSTARPTKMYSGYCLRPYPASRGNYAVDYSKKANVKMRKGTSQTDQEDAFLLKIIEGYCSLSHGSRSKKLSASSRAMGDVYQPPQLLVAEDEKIFVEEMIGDEVVVHEKTLVDTVYALKDQINSLQRMLKEISVTLESEMKRPVSSGHFRSFSDSSAT